MSKSINQSILSVVNPWRMQFINLCERDLNKYDKYQVFPLTVQRVTCSCHYNVSSGLPHAHAQPVQGVANNHYPYNHHIIFIFIMLDGLRSFVYWRTFEAPCLKGIFRYFPHQRSEKFLSLPPPPSAWDRLECRETGPVVDHLFH